MEKRCEERLWKAHRFTLYSFNILFLFEFFFFLFFFAYFSFYQGKNDVRNGVGRLTGLIYLFNIYSTFYTVYINITRTGTKTIVFRKKYIDNGTAISDASNLCSAVEGDKNKEFRGNASFLRA